MNNRSSPPVLPHAPVDLNGVAVGGRQVILAWTECGAEAGGLGFRIERSSCRNSCNPFVEAGKVGPHVAAFRGGTVELRTTRQYRVHAWNSSGDSPSSNVVEATPPLAESDTSGNKE